MYCECFTFYAVSSSPILDSARQTSSSSVRVEWSQPSGGATVTGYVVHYSDGDTDRIESVPASSTSSLITGLTNCITYTFSVEATSEHRSGESENVIVELGMYTQGYCWCVFHSIIDSYFPLQVVYYS